MRIIYLRKSFIWASIITAALAAMYIVLPPIFKLAYEGLRAFFEWEQLMFDQHLSSKAQILVLLPLYLFSLAFSSVYHSLALENNVTFSTLEVTMALLLKILVLMLMLPLARSIDEYFYRFFPWWPESYENGNYYFIVFLMSVFLVGTAFLRVYVESQDY